MKLRLETDVFAGMAYLRLRRGKVAVTREVQGSDLVLIDYDRKGRVLGVEFPWQPPSGKTTSSFSGITVTAADKEKALAALRHARREWPEGFDRTARQSL